MKSNRFTRAHNKCKRRRKMIAHLLELGTPAHKAEAEKVKENLARKGYRPPKKG